MPQEGRNIFCRHFHHHKSYCLISGCHTSKMHLIFLNVVYIVLIICLVVWQYIYFNCAFMLYRLFLLIMFLSITHLNA